MLFVMLVVGEDNAAVLSCCNSGSWSLPPTDTSDSFVDVQFNRSRFVKSNTHQEPPDHYLNVPAPQVAPRYSIVRPVAVFHPETTNEVSRMATTTLSSGSIHQMSGKLSKRQKPLQFTPSPFSKIPRQRHKSPGKVSLSKSTSYVPQEAQTIPLQSSFDCNASDPSTSLQYTITVSKRSNGNQPWEASNVRPPMLGKMRRMTLQFAPYEGPRFEVLFQCKDIKPKLHEGRLIVSANDKGAARSSTSSMPQDETIFRTNLPPSTVSQAINVYLKPCWRGFGTNRERPVFSVTVAVRPADKECAFVVLHSWDVELHSHKMESSNKGKAMDANGPFEVRGSIPLELMEPPKDNTEPSPLPALS